MRFQVLTWGVIAFIKGDNAPSKWWVGPQDRSLGNKPVFRAEAAALLYVARKTVGAVDVTLDCKGVPQTVARTQGWKSEDLFQEIREQAERVQTTWVSSHMPWETFREKFGAQNWWRWQANQNVDKLVQDAANQTARPCMGAKRP